MLVSSTKLALALARAISAVLPEPFRVVADGGMTTLVAGPLFNGWGDVGQDEFGFVSLGDVEGVARARLNRIQTDVAEELTVPWPGPSGHDMGEPWAKVENGVLQMTYVNGAGDSIVRLPDIRLAELLTNARPPATDWDDDAPHDYKAGL